MREPAGSEPVTATRTLLVHRDRTLGAVAQVQMKRLAHGLIACRAALDRCGLPRFVHDWDLTFTEAAEISLRVSYAFGANLAFAAGGLSERCEVIILAGTDYVAVTDSATRAVPLLPSRLNRAVIATVRVGVGLLWLQNAGWKAPPDFGRGDPPGGLYLSTTYAVSHQVFGPYAWLVHRLVLPNFTFFGWMVLLVEASLGAFLLIGLATRFWAVVGMAQTVVIMLSVLNAPHEWYWAYLLMLLAHMALFATAAGRYGGLDGLLRPSWQDSRSRLARLLVRVS